MIPRAVFAPAVSLQAKFSLSNQIFSNFGVCHRRLHMFCQSQERPGSSWKILRSAAEVWCWRLPVTGRHIIKLLSVSVWANFNSQPFTVSVGWRPGLVLARMSQVWSSRQILLVLPTHSHFLKNQSFKYLNWKISNILNFQNVAYYQKQSLRKCFDYKIHCSDLQECRLHPGTIAV